MTTESTDTPDLEDALDGLIAAARYAEAIGETDLDHDIGRLYQDLAQASPDEHWDIVGDQEQLVDELEGRMQTRQERLDELVREADDIEILEDDEHPLGYDEDELETVVPSMKEQIAEQYATDTDSRDDNEAYYCVPEDSGSEKPCPVCGHPFAGGDEHGWIDDGGVGDPWGGNHYYDCPTEDCDGRMIVLY